MTITLKDGTHASVRHDSAQNRFEISDDDGNQLGLTAYVPTDDGWIFYHTEVAESAGGRGVGSALVAEALKAVADGGSTVVPTCPFVVNWLEKNGESYATAGGTYRKATREDIEALRAGLADE